jgi:hypothetical protein
MEEEMRNEKKRFGVLTLKELGETLGLTIKKDKTNKILTFLCYLSAYTEDSQFNITFNAPSSSGKSYIPLEVVSLFPEEDVIKTAYASPKAFFHGEGEYNKATNTRYINLERKILVFLDQPHAFLLGNLRPLLSHDEKEITIRITEKAKGLKTKNIVIRGFPSVIYCSSSLQIDEQEATRFILLSPEMTQEKIKQSMSEALLKETNGRVYKNQKNTDKARLHLMDRIIAIKEAHIKGVIIHDPESIKDYFFSKYKKLKPRLSRDIKRLSSIIKSLTLLNLWHRESRDGQLVTSDDDIRLGIKLWGRISRAQELNLPPYVYNIYTEVILALYEERMKKTDNGILDDQNEDVGPSLTRAEILVGYFDIYESPLEEWKLRKEILPMLERTGLITQEQDPADRRQMLVRPVPKVAKRSTYNKT